MKRQFFFDLDGTLIDSRFRLFDLFNEITKQDLLEFDDYWELKRAMYGHEWILKRYFQYSDNQLNEFNEHWLSLIEQEDYLDKDRLFPFTKSVLEATIGSKYIVTARQSKANVRKQLAKLGILEYFDDIFVTEQKNTKTDLLNNSGLAFSGDDIFIGDTGHDIQTGKNLGMISVGVLSGFRNKSMLIPYHPDFLLSSIEELHAKVIAKHNFKYS